MQRAARGQTTLPREIFSLWTCGRMTDFRRANFSSPFGSKFSDTLLPALAAILMLVATSEQADAQALLVGSNSSGQTTNFTSGANTYTIAVIGGTATDSNNTLNVFNPGTRLTISGGNVQVGFGGNNNTKTRLC